MAKKEGTEVSLSSIKIGEEVEINGHTFEYEGQQMRKEGGFKRTMICFKGVSCEGFSKEFNVGVKLKFVRIKDKIILQI